MRGDGREIIALCISVYLVERYLSGIIVLLVLWLAIGAWRLRKKRVTPGPAAAAMMNELLNDDRRAAVQIILEERAAARDPEHRDDSLP
jgi:hypothetical protein